VDRTIIGDGGISGLCCHTAPFPPCPAPTGYRLLPHVYRFTPPHIVLAFGRSVVVGGGVGTWISRDFARGAAVPVYPHHTHYLPTTPTTTPKTSRGRLLYQAFRHAITVVTLLLTPVVHGRRIRTVFGAAGVPFPPIRAAVVAIYFIMGALRDGNRPFLATSQRCLLFQQWLPTNASWPRLADMGCRAAAASSAVNLNRRTDWRWPSDEPDSCGCGGFVAGRVRRTSPFPLVDRAWHREKATLAYNRLPNHMANTCASSAIYPSHANLTRSLGYALAGV